VAADGALLLGLGAVAVLLHAALRDRVSLPPGHQGVAWIALLVVGRINSRLRWAGTLAALGAAGTSLVPLLGFGDPLQWVMYLAAGVTLDIAYLLVGGAREHLWLLVLLGGLAHVTKPLLRLGISAFTGWPYGSLLWGAAYPLATHFMFGAIGAALGCGLLFIDRRR
jgi:hypothetical protein